MPTHGHLNVFLDDSHKNDKKWLRTHLNDISLTKTNWCLRSHIDDFVIYFVIYMTCGAYALLEQISIEI